MSSLILPRPDNVHGRFGTYVDGDVYNISERMRELSPHLSLQVLDPPVVGFGKTYHFAICEYSPKSGREELVMRVEALDARVIASLERMRAIPFEHRFKEMEKLEAKWAEEERERQLNELYENMGGNMYTQLERCGFIQRPVSYAKRTAIARRHRAQHGSPELRHYRKAVTEAA